MIPKVQRCKVDHYESIKASMIHVGQVKKTRWMNVDCHYLIQGRLVTREREGESQRMFLLQTDVLLMQEVL